ncbi:MAG: hypothetical protein BWX98_02146 [Candidatus Aminicenantes bacterium ADurb.Bin147]|nr:MAG: hypothetical protein BWX98_02146 [Candidatus Aminicenantes bacterium ADurb.Bin147]
MASAAVAQCMWTGISRRRAFNTASLPSSRFGAAAAFPAFFSFSNFSQAASYSRASTNALRAKW